MLNFFDSLPYNVEWEEPKYLTLRWNSEFFWIRVFEFCRIVEFEHWAELT